MLRQTLSGALQSLPKRWRDVIVLRYLVGLSEPEVATALGLSLGTVKTHTALDPQTGAFDWQTAVPGGYAALGPVSEANGVLYGESMVGDGSQPDMYALDAGTGKILWSYNAGSSVISGPSIVDGTVYWGAGYTHLGLPSFTGNNKLYAFSLNGQ